MIIVIILTVVVVIIIIIGRCDFVSVCFLRFLAFASALEKIPIKKNLEDLDAKLNAMDVRKP